MFKFQNIFSTMTKMCASYWQYRHIDSLKRLNCTQSTDKMNLWFVWTTYLQSSYDSLCLPIHFLYNYTLNSFAFRDAHIQVDFCSFENELNTVSCLLWTTTVKFDVFCVFVCVCVCIWYIYIHYKKNPIFSLLFSFRCISLNFGK